MMSVVMHNIRGDAYFTTSGKMILTHILQSPQTTLKTLDTTTTPSVDKPLVNAASSLPVKFLRCRKVSPLLPSSGAPS